MPAGPGDTGVDDLLHAAIAAAAAATITIRTLGMDASSCPTI
jgi:hypothetical protein